MADLVPDQQLSRAKVWSHAVWQRVSSLWLNRPTQDYEYRSRVIRPAVNRVLAGLNLNGPVSIVELGCGDGHDSYQFLESLSAVCGKPTRWVGIDLESPLASEARHRIERSVHESQIALADACDFRSLEAAGIRPAVFDLVYASFVLQDTADLAGFTNSVRWLLKPGGWFIASAVHPGFTEWLADEGTFFPLVTAGPNAFQAHRSGGLYKDTPVLSEGVVQWRFAGYYPLPCHDAPPFYLPHFGRLLSDYHHAFADWTGGRVILTELGPPEKVRAEVHQELEAYPFLAGAWNVYWPGIASIPSSFLLVAQALK